MAVGCEPHLEIVTNPPGADVYFDNDHLGPSPVSVAYPPSPPHGLPEMHVIEVRLPGHLPGIEYVRERPSLPGGTKRIVVNLAPMGEGMADLGMAPVQLFASPQEVSAYLSWVVCDVRLVRVSDGKVVAAAGELGRHDNLPGLLDRLAAQMNQQFRPTGRLGVLPVHNRRNSAIGRDLAKQATDLLNRRARWLTRARRPVLVTPPIKGLGRDIDDPRVLREKPIASQLQGVDYVLQAGLAESVIP